MIYDRLSFDFRVACSLLLGTSLNCVFKVQLEMVIELLLIAALGFLGSFGHCVGMCGPLAIAFSLGQQPGQSTPWHQQLRYHLLLNLGRILSYVLVGAVIGTVGSMVYAGGQLAGIDSSLRQGVAIATGFFLIWLGLSHIAPKSLPRLPLLHPLLTGKWHERLMAGMSQVSLQKTWWMPLSLGLVWGLIPCGFLYVAQIKALETGNLWQSSATLLAFGLGTMPAMLSVGVFSGLLSRDRRSQLFRLGGWLTLAIGIGMVFRTDAMVDYTGYLAIALLMLALVARPISRLWSAPLRYRRAIGVGAFVCSVAHALHSLDHTFNWQWQALQFMLPAHQIGTWFGIASVTLLLPAALTSFDGMVARLGKYWRWVHLLTVPALVLATVHVVMLGSHFWGNLQPSLVNKGLSGVLVGAVLLVLMSRDRRFWQCFALERFYAEPQKRSAPLTPVSHHDIT